MPSLLLLSHKFYGAVADRIRKDILLVEASLPPASFMLISDWHKTSFGGLSSIAFVKILVLIRQSRFKLIFGRSIYGARGAIKLIERDT